ncbi:MAG: hypothetical protein LBH00_13130 [Planctomycetaceae bacterium]|jgi:type II secretory pathway pseudopilin PulG|nr:hypothetical protein [Planctomycetaceae bacterium]
MTGYLLKNAQFRDGLSTKLPKRGISLIEVLASILVIGIGLLGVLAVIPYGAFQISEAHRTDYAANMLVNAAEEVVLRKMTNPGKWGVDFLISGNCPANLETDIKTWHNTAGIPTTPPIQPSGKIPIPGTRDLNNKDTEHYLVMAHRAGTGLILNCSKYILIDPFNSNDPPEHIFRIGATFTPLKRWEEWTRGQDDIVYTSYEDKRPDFADQNGKVRSSGKYTWFFTFLPQKLSGSISCVHPTSAHFGCSNDVSPISGNMNNIYLYKVIPNPDYIPPGTAGHDPSIPQTIRVRCSHQIPNPDYKQPNDPNYDPNIPPTITENCPPLPRFTTDTSTNPATGMLRVETRYETRLREAKTLLIDQKYYWVDSVTKGPETTCDNDCSPVYLHALVTALTAQEEQDLKINNAPGERRRWYIPKPFETLCPNVAIDILACWNRVPEDDVQVPDKNTTIISFTPANNGGSFKFSNATHLEKLTQTKYVFVTWDTTSSSDGITRANGTWCRIVFVNKSNPGTPQIFVTGNISGTANLQVYIPSGVLFHKRVDAQPVR